MKQFDDFEDEMDDRLEEPLSERQASQAVLFTTDWTVGTLIDQLERENIDVGPRFQRRDVWQTDRKSRYIESLMLHLPVPAVVLAEKRDTKGKYLVLDGRQRLLAIMQFRGLAPASERNGFALKHLDVIDRAEGLTWSEVSSQAKDLIDQLENSPVRSVVVRNWKTVKFLHLLFTRLNTETTKLNAQELRLAAYPGDFVYFVDDQSVQSGGLARLFPKTEAGRGDPRMRDAELLLRYFAFRNRLEAYKGPMRPFLDDTCLELNAQWGEQEAKFCAQMDEFEAAVQRGFEVFGDGFGRRWDPDSETYRGRRNRAVLDLLLHFLARLKNPDVDSGKIEAAFRSVSAANESFNSSIDATARHASESTQRFPILTEALNQKGIDLSPRC